MFGIHDNTSAFYLDKLPVENDLILAPMDGYTDSAMRRICRRHGSALSYTEFISTQDYLHRPSFTQRRFTFHPEERPIVFQLLGEDLDILTKVALELMRYEPDVIDINMGCPQRGIVARGAGAGLMRTPDKVAQLFQRLSKILDIPLTAKIRLGLDDESRNALLIARIVEENGGALLAVHGRTRQQGYHGAVDLDAMADICHALHIPVLVSGGVEAHSSSMIEDIQRIKAYTGCAGMMIGRAAIGNPWVFARRKREDIPISEVLNLMQTHLTWMLDLYGTPLGIISFRKHTTRYLAPYDIPRSAMLPLLTTESPQEYLGYLLDILYKEND